MDGAADRGVGLLKSAVYTILALRAGWLVSGSSKAIELIVIGVIGIGLAVLARRRRQPLAGVPEKEQQHEVVEKVVAPSPREVDDETEDETDAAAAESVRACLECLSGDGLTAKGDRRLVCSFDLQTCDDIYDLFWADDFYASFLRTRCGNDGPKASPWLKGSRVIETLHPLATSISIPGLNFKIPTVKTQICSQSKVLSVFESSRFAKIPYADALTVETTWIFKEAGDVTRVHIFYRCVFDDSVLAVPSWMKWICVSKTKSELALTYGNWRDEAREALLHAEKANDLAAFSDASFSDSEIDDDDDDDEEDDERSSQSVSLAPSLSTPLSVDGDCPPDSDEGPHHIIEKTDEPPSFFAESNRPKSPYSFLDSANTLFFGDLTSPRCATVDPSAPPRKESYASIVDGYLKHYYTSASPADAAAASSSPLGPFSQEAPKRFSFSRSPRKKSPGSPTVSPWGPFGRSLGRAPSSSPEQAGPSSEEVNGLVARRLGPEHQVLYT